MERPQLWIQAAPRALEPQLCHFSGAPEPPRISLGLSFLICKMRPLPPAPQERTGFQATEDKCPARYPTRERWTANKCNYSYNPGVISPVGQLFGNHLPKEKQCEVQSPVCPRKPELKGQQYDKEQTSTHWLERQTRTDPPALKVQRLLLPSSQLGCTGRVASTH